MNGCRTRNRPGRPHDRGGILASRLIDGKYTDFEKLGAPFNTGTEAHPSVAQGESYLIFDAVGEAGRGLYISFRSDDGAWEAPLPLKEHIGEAGVAMISPDGKYLFYTDKGDIYWVPTKIIETLR